MSIEDPLGWESLEPASSANADAFEALNVEQFNINAKIHSVFKSKTGKEVLQWLRQQTIESAAWMPSIAISRGIDAANAHAYAREGQNALVRDIETRIELAEKCKEPKDLGKHIKAKE